MRQKFKSQNGFTLYEMLCAALLLALLCVMMTSGISFAIANYRNAIAEDESELLMDSLVNAIADKYRYAVVEGQATEDDVIYVEDVGTPSIDSGFALLGGKKILPDGAYSVKGRSGDVLRRYLVEKFIVTRSVDPQGYSLFQVELRIVEKNNLGRPCEREFTVACLTPERAE